MSRVTVLAVLGAFCFQFTLNDLEGLWVLCQHVIDLRWQQRKGKQM